MAAETQPPDKNKIIWLCPRTPRRKGARSVKAEPQKRQVETPSTFCENDDQEGRLGKQDIFRSTNDLEGFA